MVIEERLSSFLGIKGGSVCPAIDTRRLLFDVQTVGKSPILRPAGWQAGPMTIVGQCCRTVNCIHVAHIPGTALIELEGFGCMQKECR